MYSMNKALLVGLCQLSDIAPSPASQQGLDPCWPVGFTSAISPTTSLLVGGFSLARAQAGRAPTPHPPTSMDTCPCAQWAETNLPTVINKLPPRSMFITVVNVMFRPAHLPGACHLLHCGILRLVFHLQVRKANSR